MNTKTADKNKTQTGGDPRDSQSRGQVAVIQKPEWDPALAEDFGVTPNEFTVFREAIWPGAKTTAAIRLALAYCKSRNLDPMKRVVHIVPMYDKVKREQVETIWPGIAELRTTATRTGEYAGCDDTIFGPEMTREFVHIQERGDPKRKSVTFPEWAQVVVYRIVKGQRVPFRGPKVYWLESYATESFFSEIPNAMWLDRPSGQVEKCAEAGSLRRAFPEEIGGEMAAEEMWGRTIDGTASVTSTSNPAVDPKPNGDAPPRPTRDSVAADAKRDDAKPSGDGKPKEEEPELKLDGGQKKDEAPAKPEVFVFEPIKTGNDDFDDWMKDQAVALSKVTTIIALDGLEDQVMNEIPEANNDLLDQWRKACADRAKVMQQRKPR